MGIAGADRVDRVDVLRAGRGRGRVPHAYGCFTTADDGAARVGVAAGDRVLDLTEATRLLLPGHAALFAGGTLDTFLAAGRGTWREVHAAVAGLMATDPVSLSSVEPFLLPAGDVTMRLPFIVADYVDFYASEHHATNVGRIYRPGSEPLTPSWRHMPLGYHGRAGTVVVSGTPVARPRGQRRTDDGVVFGPSQRLDVEAELGFVVGTPSRLGEPVALDAFADHVFGVCVVNDWSARDIQSWETVPLGPFLGKSFATSVSPWVVPLEALAHARVAPPPRASRLLPYLDDTGAGAQPWGLDIDFVVRLNGHVVSRPPFSSMYWTGAQMLAHLTSNGASLRTGDLFASGTVSGPARDQRGSLLELSWAGAEPLLLPDGTSRTFLEDGDEVVISATAPGAVGTTIDLGEVRGVVHPSPPAAPRPSTR